MKSDESAAIKNQTYDKHFQVSQIEKLGNPLSLGTGRRLGQIIPNVAVYM